MSRAAAIAAKCRDCICDEHQPGTWREQTAACTVVACPLWPYRPAATRGPLSDPPRDPASVPAEWLRASIRSLKTGHSGGEVLEDTPEEGVAA